MIAEAQVADGHAAGLLGVVLEVRLNVLVGVVADDLDGVLVGAHGAVAAQAPELALDGAGAAVLGRPPPPGRLRLVTSSTMPMVNWFLGRPEPAPHIQRTRSWEACPWSPDHSGQPTTVLSGDAAYQSGDHVQVQRLAQSAGLLGAVQHRNLLGGGGDGGDQLVRAEGRYRRTFTRPTFSPWAFR